MMEIDCLRCGQEQYQVVFYIKYFVYQKNFVDTCRVGQETLKKQTAALLCVNTGLMFSFLSTYRVSCGIWVNFQRNCLEKWPKLGVRNCRNMLEHA